MSSPGTNGTGTLMHEILSLSELNEVKFRKREWKQQMNPTHGRCEQ